MDAERSGKVKKYGFWVIPLVLLLAACNFDLTTDLYAQDIADVQESGETIYTNATLALEYGGDADRKQKIVDLLQQQLRQVGNIRDEERGYSTYLVVDHKLPLVYANDVTAAYTLPEVRENMFTFVVTPGALNIAFNRNRFNALDATLYDQFYQHLEFENFTMSLFLRNDAREPLEVTFYSVYANGIPIPYNQTFTLDRRDDMEIKFSDVLRDSAITPDAAESAGITVRKFAELNAVDE